MNHPIPPAKTTPAREPRRPLSVAAALTVASAAVIWRMVPGIANYTSTEGFSDPVPAD